jgi:hypothetical protein
MVANIITIIITRKTLKLVASSDLFPLRKSNNPLRKLGINDKTRTMIKRIPHNPAN